MPYYNTAVNRTLYCFIQIVAGAGILLIKPSAVNGGRELGGSVTCAPGTGAKGFVGLRTGWLYIMG